MHSGASVIGRQCSAAWTQIASAHSALDSYDQISCSAFTRKARKRVRISYAILRIAEKRESASVVNFFEGKIKNASFKKIWKL
jgi:hypothetical protein